LIVVYLSMNMADAFTVCDAVDQNRFTYPTKIHQRSLVFISGPWLFISG
jgi:hypothetical protein